MIFKKLFCFIILVFLFFVGLIFANKETFADTYTPPFPDVPCDHWAVDYISAIKDAGITTGYPDGTFRPGEPVTRAQMAAFIIRAIEGEPTNYNSNPYFADVPPTHWAFKYIQRVKERNIAHGYPGNLYGPEDDVTREQMAKMLIMGLVSEGEITEPPEDYCSSGSSFPDVEQDRWSCRYIKRLKELGITTGYPDGTYRPEASVTRAEMAAFIYRAFLKNLIQGAQAASSLFAIGGFTTDNADIMEIFENFEGFVFGPTDLDSTNFTMFISEALKSDKKLTTKFVNLMVIKAALLKKIIGMKTPSEYEIVNCPDGGIYSVTYDYYNDNLDVIVQYNACKLEGAQLDGIIKITTTEKDFTLYMGTDTTPFTILETEDNYVNPVSKQDINLVIYGKNFTSDAYYVNGTCIINGTINTFDYYEQQRLVITFSNLICDFTSSFLTDGFIISVTENGKVYEESWIEDIMQERVEITLANLGFGMTLHLPYIDWFMNGEVIVDFTPDVCLEGILEFDTITPIRYDYTVDHLIAGEVIINEITMLTCNPDGSITITADNQSITYLNEDELIDLCYK